jgi:hypothetical protein
MSLHSFTSPNTAQARRRVSLALVARERLQDQPFAATAGRPRRPPRLLFSSPSVALPAAQLGLFGTASHVSLRLPCRNSTAPERLPSHSLTGNVAATRATSSPPRQPSLCAVQHSTAQLTAHTAQHSAAHHRVSPSTTTAFQNICCPLAHHVCTPGQRRVASCAWCNLSRRLPEPITRADEAAHIVPR